MTDVHERAERLLARELERFEREHPRSAELARRAHSSLLAGVPMHWMRDWSTPHPLFVRKARGVELEDVDGNAYLDFCFGDTGAMFGHSPPSIARWVSFNWPSPRRRASTPPP